MEYCFFACFRFLIFLSIFQWGAADPICPYVRTPMQAMAPSYDASRFWRHEIKLASALDLGQNHFQCCDFVYFVYA